VTGARAKGAATAARWIVTAVVTGALGALLVAGFDRSLDFLLSLAASTPRAGAFAPAAGALLVGLSIITWKPGAGGEGIPSYLVAVNRGRGRLGTAETILKFPATVVTLGSGCSGGIVGPLARMGAGIGSIVTRLLSRIGLAGEGDMRTATLCGASAAVSAIFHSPLGGAFFAAEILRRESMRYADIFPALLAGIASYATSAALLGEAPVFRVPPAAGPAAGIDHLWMPLAALLSGAAGMLFILLFRRARDLLHRLPGGAPSRTLLAGIVVSVILLAGGGAVSSVSMDFFADIAAGRFAGGTGAGPVLLLAGLLLLKIVAVSITVGSGLSGGFTGPLVIFGIGGGALVAGAAGIDPGTGSWAGLLACGMAASLGAVMNIPVAAVLITVAVFGAQTIIPSAMGGLIAFVCFRSRTIYEYALAPVDGDTRDILERYAAD